MEIESADIEVWENPDKGIPYRIEITYPEFTCLCPRMGYPDFATVEINYSPGEYIVELKSLKLYLNSFRNRYISHEEVSTTLFREFMKRVKPKWLDLTLRWNPRGNMSTVVKVSSRGEEAMAPPQGEEG